MVIGRPGYDNYLVARAVAERGRVSSVDVTNALVALHQTDDDGVKAGHRARDDHDWNLERIGDEWRDGRTEMDTIGGLVHTVPAQATVMILSLPSPSVTLTITAGRG